MSESSEDDELVSAPVAQQAVTATVQLTSEGEGASRVPGKAAGGPTANVPVPSQQIGRGDLDSSQLPSFSSNTRPYDRLDSGIGSLDAKDATLTKQFHDLQKPTCAVCHKVFADSTDSKAECCKCRGTSPTTTLSTAGDSIGSSAYDSLKSTSSVNDSLKSIGNVNDSLKSIGSNGSHKRVSGDYDYLTDPSSLCQPAAGNHYTLSTN